MYCGPLFQNIAKLYNFDCHCHTKFYLLKNCTHGS